MSEQRVRDNWRAIEALRSGVPNRDAGGACSARPSRTSSSVSPNSLQRSITAAKRVGCSSGASSAPGSRNSLEYLQHVALTQRFVASKIVISKETPLHDPVKVFRTAAATAVVPDRRGTALSEIANALDFEGSGYSDLARWVKL